MADPLIESGVIAEWLGESLSDTEETQVDAMIVYGSARLRRAVPNLDARLDQWAAEPGVAGSLDPELVKGAMRSAVVRALESIRTSDGRGRIKTEKYPEVETTYVEPSQAELRAAVYFTDEELDDLMVDGGGRDATAPQWCF